MKNTDLKTQHSDEEQEEIRKRINGDNSRDPRYDNSLSDNDLGAGNSL